MSRVSSKFRQKVIERAKGFCEYCQSDSAFSQDPFDIEHILPISEGGKTESENLALACHGCNVYKSNKTVGYDDLSEENARLFNPRTDVWKEHFAWSKDFTVIVGLTAIARVTIAELKMNRLGLRNQRAVFYFTGNHPPVF